MLIKISKGFAISLTIFVLLSVLFAVLIAYTSVPESLGSVFIIVSVSLSCMFLGAYVSGLLSNPGILCGAVGSVILIAIIAVPLYWGFDRCPIELKHMLMFLIPISAGATGGFLGRNLRD